MTTLIFDLEANGLSEEADRIWVLCCEVLETGARGEFLGNEHHRFVAFLENNSVSTLVGHNIEGYDLPVLSKVWGFDATGFFVLDTFWLSSAALPDRHAGHSLEAWAKRLTGVEPKVEQERWDVFDPNMIVRCWGDVEITKALYRRLQEEFDAWTG